MSFESGTEKANNTQNKKKSTDNTTQASLSEMRSRLGSAVTRNPSGETLKALADALQKQLEEQGLQDSYKLLAVDGAQNGLRISSVLIYRTEGRNTGVATLLLEGTCGHLRPREFGTQHNRVELPTTAGHLYDNVLIEENFNTLARHSRLDIENLVAAFGLVIPKELSPSADISLVRNILFNATNAIDNYLLDQDPNAPRWDISRFNNSVTFEGRIDSSPEKYYTQTGLPCRADYMIDVVGRENRNAVATSSQARADDILVSRTAAYVEFMYVGPKEIRDQYGRAVGVSSQVYSPRITVTAVETDINISPEMYLQGLSSVFSLGIGNADSQVWCNRFSNQVDGNGIHRDLRSLSYECLDTPIDVADTSFNASEFLRQFVDIEPVWVIHAEDVGPFSFITEILVGAAENSTNRKKEAMKKYLYSAAMSLTGGRMIWNPEQPICEIEKDSKILMGTWPDRDGVRHDLREIDLLWVYTHFGATEWDMCLRFADTFKFNAPLEVRLAERLALYTQMLNRTPTVTGEATPLIIYPEWGIALREGLRAAGGDLRFDSLTYGASRGTREYAQLRRYSTAAFNNYGGQGNVGPGYTGYVPPTFTRGRF